MSLTMQLWRADIYLRELERKNLIVLELLTWIYRAKECYEPEDDLITLRWKKYDQRILTNDISFWTDMNFSCRREIWYFLYMLSRGWQHYHCWHFAVRYSKPRVWSNPKPIRNHWNCCCFHNYNYLGCCCYHLGHWVHYQCYTRQYCISGRISFSNPHAKRGRCRLRNLRTSKPNRRSNRLRILHSRCPSRRTRNRPTGESNFWTRLPDPKMRNPIWFLVKGIRSQDKTWKGKRVNLISRLPKHNFCAFPEWQSSTSLQYLIQILLLWRVNSRIKM